MVAEIDLGRAWLTGAGGLGELAPVCVDDGLQSVHKRLLGDSRPVLELVVAHRAVWSVVRDVGVQPVGGVQADLLATVEDHVVRDVPARGRCPAAARRVDAELPGEGRPALGERRLEDLLEAAHAELMLSVVDVVGLAEHTPHCPLALPLGD